MKTFSSFIIILSIFGSLSVSLFAESEFYDETFADDGSPRPHYKAAYDDIGSWSKTKRLQFLRDTKRELKKDFSIGPMARIIPEDQFERLKRGTEQRVRMFQAFFKDHYGGTQTYRDAVIPGAIMDDIEKRTGERPYRRFLNGDSVFRYNYGDDIIVGLDDKGKPVEYVLEDNFNFVGGNIGDMIPAREIYETKHAELMDRMNVVNDPVDFANGMMDRFAARANPKIGYHKDEGAFVLLATPPYADHEDSRMAQEMHKRFNAVLVTPGMKDKKLVVTKDRVELHETTQYGKTYVKPVGFIYMNSEDIWYDWSHPAVRERVLKDEAEWILTDKRLKPDARARLEEAIQKRNANGEIDIVNLEEAIKKCGIKISPSAATHKPLFPGLMEAVLDGRVQTNSTPGIEIAGDKMFHTYVPELIRHYLKEEPILQNPETNRFYSVDKNGKFRLNPHTLRRAQADRDKWVLKVVDGRGGDGIYIGAKMSDEDWANALEKARKEPRRYVLQRFKHPSVVSDGETRRIGDVRMYTYVDGEHIVVSGTPYARSNVIDGDGKVNMSLKGTMNVVLVVRDCESIARKLAEE